MANPFATEGMWLKAQLHCHTTNSDGEIRPEALMQHYGWAGYDVVAITDHWHITKPPSTGSVLAITGAELNADLPGDERYCDFLAFGIEELLEDPEVRSNNSFPDMSAGAKWVNEQGGVAYLAHPYWSGIRHNLVVESEGFAGLEVFNGSCEDESGRADSSALWDELMEEGKPFSAIATDDSHYPGFDLDRAWTWLRVAERSEEAVLDALRTGMAYSSAGPVIHEIDVDDAGATVRCSPARVVILHTRYELGAGVRGAPRPRVWNGRPLATNDEGLITAARLDFEEPLPWFRVVVTDAAGRQAWTNPL